MGFNTEILKLWEIQNVCLYSFAWKYIHIWSLDRFQFSANLESLSHTLFLPHSICAHVYMCVRAFVCVCVYLPISHCFSLTLSLHLSMREKERKREFICVCVPSPLTHSFSVTLSHPCVHLYACVYLSQPCHLLWLLCSWVWPGPNYCETPDPSACASWETRTK